MKRNSGSNQFDAAETVADEAIKTIDAAASTELATAPETAVVVASDEPAKVSAMSRLTAASKVAKDRINTAATGAKNAAIGAKNQVQTQVKTQAKRLQTPEIVVVDGDQLPQETRISKDSEGLSGFRVGEVQFVAIGRDVASIAVRPTPARAGVKKLLVWGAVGAFAAGPVGALAGGLLGGRKLKRVTADLRLNDGQALTIETDMSILERMRKEMGTAQAA